MLQQTPIGTTGTYTITASLPSSGGGASGVNISDTLPTGFTYASTTSVVLTGSSVRTSTTNPTVGTATPAWGVFDILSGGSVQITFTVDISNTVATGTYQNPASASYLDPVRVAGDPALTVNYDPASSTGEDVTVTLPLSCGLSVAQWAFELPIGANATPAFTTKASDVATATTQVGAGLTNPAIAAAGNPGNAWTATGFGTAAALNNVPLNDYFQFEIDATNYTDLVLTFHANRTTPTGVSNGGPTTMAVFYTLDRTAGVPVYTQLGGAYAIPIPYNAAVFTADFSAVQRVEQ